VNKKLYKATVSSQ